MALGRDIHPGNVLVQEDLDPSQGDSSEYILLADLGEARAIDMVVPEKVKNSRISRVELKEYVPPEVHGQGYTTKSDIFAWGQLAIDIIRQGHFALVWEDGQIRFPKRLMFILESCLANDPRGRPTAATLDAMIRDVTFELLGRPENATDWILGDYKLPKVAQRLSTSLQLSSEWFRSD
jgi:serine/threonine protein kinase